MRYTFHLRKHCAVGAVLRTIVSETPLRGVRNEPREAVVRQLPETAADTSQVSESHQQRHARERREAKEAIRPSPPSRHHCNRMGCARTGSSRSS